MVLEALQSQKHPVSVKLQAQILAESKATLLLGAGGVDHPMYG